VVGDDHELQGPWTDAFDLELELAYERVETLVPPFHDIGSIPPEHVLNSIQAVEDRRQNPLLELSCVMEEGPFSGRKDRVA
jgi:hypothetical protein